jgi:hypothetical protein
VTTPMWFALGLGTIYVETHGDAGKLKRLRHTPRVTLASCACSGKVTRSESEGYARILTEPAKSTAASPRPARCQGGKNPKDQLSARGSGVNRCALTCQHLQPHTSYGQVMDSIDQMPHIPS